MYKHYRWLAVPMGALGALMVWQGWLAFIFGLAYGQVCLFYAHASIREQDERWADEELERLLSQERDA